MRHTRCAACHIPNTPTTKEKALKIYNLDEADWSATLSDRQLEVVAAADTANAADRKKLAAFIAREMAFRGTNPSAR
jgi:hypothetical protein